MYYYYLNHEYKVGLRFDEKVEVLSELKKTFDDLSTLENEFFAIQKKIYKTDYPLNLNIQIHSITKNSPIEIVLNVDFELLGFLFFILQEYGTDWQTIKKISKDSAKLKRILSEKFKIAETELDKNWDRMVLKVNHFIDWFNEQPISVQHKYLKFVNKISRTINSIKEIWIEKK